MVKCEWGAATDLRRGKKLHFSPVSIRAVMSLEGTPLWTVDGNGGSSAVLHEHEHQTGPRISIDSGNTFRKT